MDRTQTEQYGKLALTNIFTSVWVGDWDRYEKIFQSMDGSLRESFPFHDDYNRETVNLWYENHFFIPGDYFVSPYFSSYTDKNMDVEERKKNLLCLIGTYEKMGFYFPLEEELYPDHIGCLTAFIGAVQQEKIKATLIEDIEMMNYFINLEKEIALNYILPIISTMQKNSIKKIKHPFFSKFLSFYSDLVKDVYIKH